MTAIRKNRSRRGLHGVSSSAITGILGMIAGILLVPLIIGRVGSAAYGPWLVITAIASYLQYADVGVGSAIVHFGSRARGGARERQLDDYVSAGLLWNVGAAVIAVPIYAALSTWYMDTNAARAGLDHSEVVGLVALGSSMLGCVLVAPFSSALVGSGLMPIERRNQSIGVIVRVAGTVAACLFTGDVVWVAAAEMVGTVLPQVLALFELLHRRLLKLRWGRDTMATLRFMLAYSLKSFGVSAVGAMILQAGTVIVGSFLGPSDVTYFNAAFRVYASVRQVLTWTIDPFRSVLSRLFARDEAGARRVLVALTFSSFGVACLGVGTLAFACNQLVRIWLGPHAPVAEVSITLVVLLLGFVVNATQIPLVPAGDAIGKPGAFFSVQLVWLIGFLIIACGSVNRLGIVGVALGLGVPLIVVSPLYLLRAQKVLELQPRQWFLRGVLPTMIFIGPGIVGAVLAVLIQGILGREPFSIASGAVFAIVACAAAFLFRHRLPFGSIAELLRVEL